MEEINEKPENLVEQAPEPEKIPRWRVHFWPVVVAVLLTTLLLSAFGWYWAKEADKKEAELESYIDFLRNPKNVKTN